MDSQHGQHAPAGRRIGRRRFLTMAAAVAAGMAIHPPRAQAADEVVIGGTLSQSGPFQGAIAPFGKLTEAWVESVNAHGGLAVGNRKLKVRLVIYDDQSDPAVALRSYERLATVDKVNLFIGPFTSFLTNAALQAASTNKLPFFMVEANDPVLFETPNPWRAGHAGKAVDEHGRIAQLYAAKRGVKTFALLSRDNLHENQAMEGFGDALKKAGFEVVFQETAPKDIKDFSSIIVAMKQKSPDVVFVESIPPPYTIGFLKQARELGLNPKDIVLGHAPLPVVKAMGSAAENIVSNLYSFDGDSPDHKAFEALCQKAGFEPWQYSESGQRYVVFRRVEDALRRAGSLDAEAIRKAMWDTNLSLFGGELVIKHDSEGYGTMQPWPAQVQGGKYISLWPLEQGVKRHRFKNGQW